ncbi:MFS transporter [Microbacterium aurum]
MRSTGSLSDPVLRILVTSTAVGRIGRGVFLAVTVLYFTRIVGLSAGEIAVVLTVSAGLGVAASAITGHLADRISARRILLAGMTLDGVALVAYAFAADFWAVLAIGAVVGVAESAANAARMAIIARAFDGPRRVSARAILRTVTNISIAAGAAAGGLALLADTGLAYRAAIVAAGLVVLAGVPIMRGLPPRVDAPRVVPAAPAADSAVPTAAGTATAPPATPVVRRASPWRDARYLALTALSAVFGMQFGLAEVGVPLWIAHDTAAPTAIVAALLILNTVIVVIFQVPLSRGTHDVRRAGTVTAWAGVLMVLACALYAGAAPVVAWLAVALLIAAALAHAFAEVMSQAGGWGLSFELADPRAPGAYQGVFSMGFNLGAMAAPIVVTAALGLGLAGWALLAVVFAASALGTTLIAWRSAKGLDAADRRVSAA